MAPSRMNPRPGTKLYSMLEDTGEPSKNAVQLQWVTRSNKKLSIQEGRPVFDKCIQLSIISPGAPKQEFATIVKRIDVNGNVRTDGIYSQKFAQQIEHFEREMDGGGLAGTPLFEWPLIDMAQAESLKAMHVYTVEQLAGLEGQALQNVGMGAQALQQKARAWLENANGAAPIARLTEENERLKGDVERLQQQLGELAARLEAKESKKRTKASEE